MSDNKRGLNVLTWRFGLVNNVENTLASQFHIDKHQSQVLKSRVMNGKSSWFCWQQVSGSCNLLCQCVLHGAAQASLNSPCCRWLILVEDPQQSYRSTLTHPNCLNMSPGSSEGTSNNTIDQWTHTHTYWSTPDQVRLPPGIALTSTKHNISVLALSLQANLLCLCLQGELCGYLACFH